jgi:hypothetical protein
MSGAPRDPGRPPTEDDGDATADDEIDEESEESFPASDPPPHWAGPPDR